MDCGLFFMLLFKNPKWLKSGRFRLGECGHHSGSRRLLISRFLIDGRAPPSWCCLYVELPHLVETIARLNSHHDVFQAPSITCLAINVTLPRDSDCLLVCIFKTKRFWDGHLAVHFHRGPLKQLVCGFCAPVHIVMVIDKSTEPEVCFVAEPNIIKDVKILSNLFLELPAYH